MSREQNWYIRRYVRAVSGFLPCSGKRKKSWLADLRAQAESYVAEGGDAAALEQRFGTPQQMALSYVDEMPTADLLAELHIRRRLVAVTVIALAAALAILAAALVWQQYTLHKDLSGWNRTMVTNVRTWTVDD